MRGQVQSVRVFEEAVGVLVKGMRMSLEVERMTRNQESAFRGCESGFEALIVEVLKAFECPFFSLTFRAM
jgi:hypothetical protein